MPANPRKKPVVKLVRLPKANRFIMKTDECDITFHFKEGNAPTNALINWLADRIKMAVHS